MKTFTLRVYYDGLEKWKDDSVDTAVGVDSCGSGVDLQTMRRDLDYDFQARGAAEQAERRAAALSFVVKTKIITREPS